MKKTHLFFLLIIVLLSSVLLFSKSGMQRKHHSPISFPEFSVCCTDTVTVFRSAHFILAKEKISVPDSPINSIIDQALIKAEETHTTSESKSGSEKTALSDTNESSEPDFSKTETVSDTYSVDTMNGVDCGSESFDLALNSILDDYSFYTSTQDLSTIPSVEDPLSSTFESEQNDYDNTVYNPDEYNGNIDACSHFWASNPLYEAVYETVETPVIVHHDAEWLGIHYENAAGDQYPINNINYIYYYGGTHLDTTMAPSCTWNGIDHKWIPGDPDQLYIVTSWQSFYVCRMCGAAYPDSDDLITHIFKENHGAYTVETMPMSFEAVWSVDEWSEPYDEELFTYNQSILIGYITYSYCTSCGLRVETGFITEEEYTTLFLQ